MDAPIKIAVGLWVAAIIIVLGISTIGGALAVQRLDTAATQVKDVIASDGVYDDATQEDVNDFLRRNNLSSAMISISSDNGDVSTMSLGDRFFVTLTQPFKIGIGGIGFTPITLHGHAEGMSEVYRK